MASITYTNIQVIRERSQDAQAIFAMNKCNEPQTFTHVCIGVCIKVRERE